MKLKKNLFEVRFFRHSHCLWSLLKNLRHRYHGDLFIFVVANIPFSLLKYYSTESDSFIIFCVYWHQVFLHYIQLRTFCIIAKWWLYIIDTQIAESIFSRSLQNCQVCSMLFNSVLYLVFLTFFYSRVIDESFVDEARVWRNYKILILVVTMSLFTMISV